MVTAKSEGHAVNQQQKYIVKNKQKIGINQKHISILEKEVSIQKNWFPSKTRFRSQIILRTVLEFRPTYKEKTNE